MSFAILKGMKNLIIVVLVITLGVLGYLFITRDDSPETTNSSASTQSGEADSESASGKVLDLSNSNLSEVPKDILDDSSVTTLDVSGNNLTGALPAEIRKLTNLEVLLASDNSMTGIPAEIGQLSKLKLVDFSNNNLSGLPLEIGNLKNLETLDLRGNPSISMNDVGLIQKEIPNTQILTDQ